MVAAKRPKRRSMPAAAAARAPVKATWLSASPGEDLAAQDDEVADRPAGERDRRACDQGDADEVLREHLGEDPCGSGLDAGIGPAGELPSRAGDQVDGEREAGDVEADRVVREVGER